jgi:protein gp37
MGENSGIEWTHHSFNPWVGCTKVSAGCTNCYAEAFDRRVGGVPVSQRQEGQKALRWGVSAPRTRTTESYWRQPLVWNEAAAAKGERARVFTASLADVFEANIRFDLDRWRLELFELIRCTPALDWQLLTKRPQNVLPMLGAALEARSRAAVAPETIEWLEAWLAGSPPANVWLGTTVEDEERAAERIPHLVAVPAAVRFLSMEPLLERVDLGSHELAGVHWVIVGGESGQKARVFEPSWAADVVAAVRAVGAAPFVKQMGSHPLGMALSDPHGGDLDEWPLELRVREFPRAGALLAAAASGDDRPHRPGAP